MNSCSRGRRPRPCPDEEQDEEQKQEQKQEQEEEIIRAAPADTKGPAGTGAGTHRASLHGMDLYDVMAEGCHTSVTAQQIAELIHAGRFKRDQVCRKVGQTRWRTIDEFFPLVEHSSGNGAKLPSDKPEQRPTAFPLGIAVALATALLAGGIHCLWLRPSHRAEAGADTPAANRGYSHSPATPRNPGSESLRIHQERLEAERRQRAKLAKEQAALAVRTKR